MAERGGHDRTPMDTELLCSDFSDTRSLFLPGPPPVRPDPSDLFYAADAHVGQLKLQKPKEIPKASDCRDLVSLRWNSFLSKDTGPGSTSPINDTPMTFLDLMRTPVKESTSDEPFTQNSEETSDTRTRRREERDIQREQIIWRLRRLLGDACEETQITVGTQPPSDSICTEDFFTRFRDQMVDLTVPDTSLQQQLTLEDPRDQQNHHGVGENEAQGMSGQRSSGNGQISSQSNNRESYRSVCSTENKEADEGTDQQMKMRWPDGRKEKMRSDWFKMKDRQQQKCRKDEEAPEWKKVQVNHAELSLSGLQQRRKHALQELARLAAEKAELEEEKNSLEFVPRDSRGQQHGRQRQRQLSSHEGSAVMSALEREEMDRQLDGAKTQLLAEQRRSREKLETMQDKLEEACEHLQMVTHSESLLRSRCASLEKKQQEDKEKMEAAESRLSELQGDLDECTTRKGVLEKTLARKELQLFDLQEQQRSWCAERDGLRGALQVLGNQLSRVAKEAQEQTPRRVQKERETRMLEKKEEARSPELQVKEVVEEERRRCEAQQAEAVRVQRERLEEEIRQRERSVALALKEEAAQLKTKLQGMERDSCAQQGGREPWLAAVCQTLGEEHQAEPQRWQKDASQDRQRLQLQLQLAQEETRRLRMMLEEKESSCHQMTARTEEQHQHWTRDLRAQCRNLHFLLGRSGGKHQSLPLPVSSTVPEALTHLRTLGEDLKNTMDLLQRRLESQKQTSECMRIPMEQERRLQAKHLGSERDQALRTVTERLLQEHMEELSSWRWARLDDGGADGGAAASLRKQLRAKDAELRQVHAGMARWREQTAARLALRLEEALTAELERCKTALFRSRPSDLASFKLLRHLQDKVKQLCLAGAPHLQPRPSPAATPPSDP